MTPYLAVLKDCFREALASRILWLLTGLITLVLFVGLAPFTLLEESAARFQRNEFRNGPEFLKYLASLETSHDATAARRVWSRLPDSVRHRLRDASSENVNDQVEILFAIRGELNGMLNNKDIYDSSLWTPQDDDSRGKAPARNGALRTSPTRTCGGSTGSSSTPPFPTTFCPLRERSCTRPGLATGWALPSPLNPSSFPCSSILRWPHSPRFWPVFSACLLPFW